MSKIEDRLLEERTRWSRLTAPEHMEARLREALSDSVPPSKPIRHWADSWKISAAAVLAIMLIAGNQYHALAYFGKTLLGFDEIINSTLSELNKQGKGQALHEQIKLADGTVFKVEGIMSDENQLILFYTLNHPNGVAAKDVNQLLPHRIQGFRTDSKLQGGGSDLSETGSETKGMLTFEPVSPLAKKLTLSYWEKLPESDQRREGHLTFPYHPDEAMPTKIKQSINQTLSIDNDAITFGQITATPTLTLIEGTLQGENDKLFDQVLNGLELLANGQPVTPIRSEIHRTPNGMAFTKHYESLPDKLQSMQLLLKEQGDKVEIPVK